MSATVVELPVNATPPAEPAARRPPARPLSVGWGTALVGVFALGAIAVFVVAYALGFSALQEQRDQHELYAQFRGLLDPSSPIAPATGGAITPGSPVAVLNSPAAGFRDLVVVEGTAPSDLLAGPGHLRDSPLPGQPGQTVLIGKSVTAGAPFAGLDRIPVGATLTAITGQGTFRYTVIGHRAAGGPVPTLPASGSLLTLITAAGSGWLGDLAPHRLVYLDAALRGSTVPAPGPRPAAVPAAELQGHDDPNAWPFVILWLQALLVAGVLATWTWTRWGRWQSWLISVPVLFGVLWGLCTEAMRLLPNVV